MDSRFDGGNVADSVRHRGDLPPKPASQPEIRDWLTGIEAQAGFQAALRGLFDWSEKAGYFASGLFESNLLLAFPDTETGVTFRTQINDSRQKYTAPDSPGTTGCPICYAQVGSPAKPLLRAHEFELGSARTPFFAQLTPYPLRRGHFIIIDRMHAPMRIGGQAIDELVDFVRRAPRFTACSNSDVRNAGVSILDHHHYQVFDSFKLPVMEASPVPGLQLRTGGTEIDFLDYPLATVRVRGGADAVTRAATAIVEFWKAMACGANTCNLTVRLVPKGYEVYLFFRNPAFQTPPDLLRVKSEGVGVVEASGEGIYPPPDDSMLEEIRRDGLVILTRILAGLNPIPPHDRRGFFEQVCARASEG